MQKHLFLNGTRTSTSSLSRHGDVGSAGMVLGERKEKVGGEKKEDVYIKLVDNTSSISVCLVLLE